MVRAEPLQIQGHPMHLEPLPALIAAKGAGRRLRSSAPSPFLAGRSQVAMSSNPAVPSVPEIPRTVRAEPLQIQGHPMILCRTRAPRCKASLGPNLASGASVGPDRREGAGGACDLDARDPRRAEDRRYCSWTKA